MNDFDIKHIVECALKGNELPFNIFFDEVYLKLKSRLFKMTKSEDDTKEVFVISMQKFWERFVINQEKTPHNSIGYIYMMCKNAWLMEKRSKTTVSIEDSYLEQNTLKDDTQLTIVKDNTAIEEDELLKHKALAEALETLSTKCRALIENQLDDNQQLKDLQTTLGYENYQALVQAKYNCKKRLVRKVYEILEKLQYQKQPKG